MILFYLDELVLPEDKVSQNTNTLQLVTASYLEDNKCIGLSDSNNAFSCK